MLLDGARSRTVMLGALLVACVSPGPLAAQEPVAASAGEHVHQVRRGDTLWDLAQRYLSNPFLWPRIHEANRQTVANPHRIYPDDRLRIPGMMADAARVGLAGLDAATPLGGRTGATEFRASGPAERTIFFVDESAIRASAVEVFQTEVDAIPRGVQPGEFHTSPWVGDGRELQVVGTMVRVRGRETRDRDLLAQTAQPFDPIYVGYGGAVRPSPDDRLLLVRRGRRIRGFGDVYEPLAIIRVDALHADVFQGTIMQQFGPVRPGDMAIPMETFPVNAAARANPVQDGAVGELVDFAVEKSVPLVRDHGFVNLGGLQGVSVGDELIAYLPERIAGSGFSERLPTEAVARLRVVRVRDRTATVVVTHLVNPSLRPGLTVQVVARQP